MRAPSSADLHIPEDMIGHGNANHFTLNSSFFLHQLAVPEQLQRLPGSEVPYGRAALSKALPDTGPSSALASAWSADSIGVPVTGNNRLPVEQFFTPEIHGNDTQFALALGRMPDPAVQYYGQSNDERYPIYGMNAANRNMVHGTGYPGKKQVISNTSADLEHHRYRTYAHNVPLDTILPQDTLSADFAAETNALELHQAAADVWTAGTSMGDATPTSIHHLPGSGAADARSQSYHTLASVEESPYNGDSSQMVHNSLLDIRRGRGTRFSSVPLALGDTNPALGGL